MDIMQRGLSFRTGKGIYIGISRIVLEYYDKND